MGFADDFLDMCPDVLVATPGTEDEFGTFTPSGTVLNLPCRIEGEIRTIRDATGQEILSTVQALCLNHHDLSTRLHRFTLPSRFSPSTNLRAIRIDKVSDDTEPVYEDVYFQ